LSKVPGSVWMRQRLNAKAEAIRDLADELTLRLLERTEAPITAHQGYVCVDIDTFAMDQPAGRRTPRSGGPERSEGFGAAEHNSGTNKEEVKRTYQGFDGYTPIAGYIGNEGWNIGLELRPGSQHSARETEYFYERLFPRIERLTQADPPVLMREDSGFDSARLLFAKAEERDRLAQRGRSFDFLTKWNPRKQDTASWVERAEAANAFVETRPGKRVGLLSLEVERSWKQGKRPFRLIVQVTERTIDKKRQPLLMPSIELEGWWTSLAVAAEDVIALYKHHGTHEQFHSELFGLAESFASLRTSTPCCPAPFGLVKTDLDLERLPSGKFDTNDALLHLAAFAYNCLHLFGPLGLTGEIAPIRHPAKRRRIKTVLQEIMDRAAKFVAHARRLVLDFGRDVAAHVEVFVALQNRLLAAAAAG